MSNYLSLFALAAVTGLLARWYYWYTHNSIRNLRGPPSKTWLLGMLSEHLETVSHALLGNIRDYFYQESVGDLDFKYINEYGTAWRQTGPLGVSRLVPCPILSLISLKKATTLMLADPKVCHSISIAIVAVF